MIYVNNWSSDGNTSEIVEAKCPLIWSNFYLSNIILKEKYFYNFKIYQSKKYEKNL